MGGLGYVTGGKSVMERVPDYLVCPYWVSPMPQILHLLDKLSDSTLCPHPARGLMNKLKAGFRCNLNWLSFRGIHVNLSLFS